MSIIVGCLTGYIKTYSWEGGGGGVPYKATLQVKLHPHSWNLAKDTTYGQ